MSARHLHSSGGTSGAQASAGAALRTPQRMALTDPTCRRLVERAAAAQELRALRREDDDELAGSLERVLAGVGLAGLAVGARWGSLASHGTGVLGRFVPAHGQRRATIVVASSMLLRGGWAAGGVVIDPLQRIGFGRLLDDILTHELGHAIARLRSGDEDARHGSVFADAAAELHERAPDRLPSPAAEPWLTRGWPMPHRPASYYGRAAPGLSVKDRAYLERTHRASVSPTKEDQ